MENIQKRLTLTSTYLCLTLGFFLTAISVGNTREVPISVLTAVVCVRAQGVSPREVEDPWGAEGGTPQLALWLQPVTQAHRKVTDLRQKRSESLIH